MAGSSSKNAVIVGAGLVGSLWSLFLKRRGYSVTVLEARPDPRQTQASEGRSINLIITAKGLYAVKQVDLHNEVLGITVPVTGRTMHDQKGELTYQPYGKNTSECNYSVSRSHLNRLLIDAAEKRGVKFQFDSPLADVHLSERKIQIKNGREHCYDVLFGADGAGSLVRNALTEAFEVEARTEWLGADYKEMHMPALNGDYAIDKNSLHIWPRGDQFLMALPNPDGSFTMTLYMKSEDFKNYKSEEDLDRLFAEKYTDAAKLMPNFKQDFFSGPSGRLGTVRCHPWVYRGEVALIGDAAHAIVPFFGQGMNSGFADCTFLDAAIDRCNGDWTKVFSEYNDIQKKNGDAIADMAIENYHEMQEHVADPKFLLKKSCEKLLEQNFPGQFRSRYSLVTYTLVSYADAQKLGIVQEQILDQLCKPIASLDQIDLKLAKSLIEEKLAPLFAQAEINLQTYDIT